MKWEEWWSFLHDHRQRAHWLWRDQGPGNSAAMVAMNWLCKYVFWMTLNKPALKNQFLFYQSWIYRTHFELSNKSVCSDNIQCCDTKDFVGVEDAMFLHHLWCDRDGGVHLKFTVSKFKTESIFQYEHLSIMLIDNYLTDMYSAINPCDLWAGIK